MTDQSPEDRVAALERGMAALTERVERLEGEVLPRPLAFENPQRPPGYNGMAGHGGGGFTS